MRWQVMAMEWLPLLVVQLHEDLVYLEFSHYDVHGTGKVLGLDLARSLVVSCGLHHIDALLDKVGCYAAASGVHLASTKLMHHWIEWVAVLQLQQCSQPLSH